MVYFWLFVQKPTSDLDKVGLLELSLHLKKHSYQIGLKYYVYRFFFSYSRSIFSNFPSMSKHYFLHVLQEG